MIRSTSVGITATSVAGHEARKGAVRGRNRSRSLLWPLAFLPVATIPFENQYTLFGISIAKLTIIPLLIGVLLAQPKRLLAVCKHPVFLCAAAFVGWGVLAEYLHPSSDYLYLYRVAQMFVFAALIATVTTDPFSFRRILMAMAVTCSLLALYLIFNFYSVINVEVAGYREAGNLRDQAFNDMSMDTGLNILGYTMGTGAVIALARLLVTEGLWRQLGWGGIYVLCAVGAFVPLSRGAFLALIVGSLFVLSRHVKSLLKPARLVLLIGAVSVAMALMPEALIERYAALNAGEEVKPEKRDGRVKLFDVAITALPQYWALGVGSGHYWREWGGENGFGHLTKSGYGIAVLGPHNAFLAAWIYFGLPGLILLCTLCGLAFRACPRGGTGSLESSVLLGLLSLGMVWMLFTHSLYIKSYSVILGLVVGAAQMVRIERRKSVRLAPPFRSALLHPSRHQWLGRAGS